MTLLCVDNSSWMGDGDDYSMRKRFLTDCVNLICGGILKSNEENAVGLLTLLAANSYAMNSPTRDIGRIFDSMRGLPKNGTLKLDAWMQDAKFLLKDAKQNKKKRIILFIGGSICEDAVTLKLIGLKLKDSKIHVDAVYFGHEGDKTSKLLDYLASAASDDNNCHMFCITNSPFDALTSIVGYGERGMGFAAGYVCGLGCEVDGHTKPLTISPLIMFDENNMLDLPLDICIEESFKFSELKKYLYFKKMKNIAMIYKPFENEEEVRQALPWEEGRSVDDYLRVKLIASDGSVAYPIYRRCDFYSLAVWTRHGLDVFGDKMLSGIDYHADLNTNILNIGLSYEKLAGEELLNYSLSSMDSSIKVISLGYKVEKHKEYCRAVAVLLGPIPEAIKLFPVKDFIGGAFDVCWDTDRLMSGKMFRQIHMWAKVSLRMRNITRRDEIPFYKYRFCGKVFVEEQILTYGDALRTVSLIHIPPNKQLGQRSMMFKMSSLVVLTNRLLFNRGNPILKDWLEKHHQETYHAAKIHTPKFTGNGKRECTTLPAIITEERTDKGQLCNDSLVHKNWHSRTSTLYLPLEKPSDGTKGKGNQGSGPHTQGSVFWKPLWRSQRFLKRTFH